MNIVSGDCWAGELSRREHRLDHFKRDIPMYPEPNLKVQINLDDHGCKKQSRGAP
jgi:hypothetical protein